MRLAHEQGLLSQKSLSYYQRWALTYWVWMDRRTRTEDLQEELEMQTLNLAPERWVVLYKDKMLGITGTPNDDGEIQIGVDELDELDSYMDQQEQKFQEVISGKHSIRGRSGQGFSDQAEPLQWGAWQ